MMKKKWFLFCIILFLLVSAAGCAPPQAKDINLAVTDIKDLRSGEWSLKADTEVQRYMYCEKPETFALRRFEMGEESLTSVVSVFGDAGIARKCFSKETSDNLLNLFASLSTESVIGDETDMMFLGKRVTTPAEFSSMPSLVVLSQTLQLAIGDSVDTKFGKGGLMYLRFRKGKVIAKVFLVSTTDFRDTVSFEREKKRLVEVAQKLLKKMP